MTKTYRTNWLAGALLLLCATRPAGAVTVPGDFATIQAALDAVSSGALPSGTVVDVQPGTYMEAVSYTDTTRSITLRGMAGAATTIINSAGTGLPALTIRDVTGTVVVDGFTMTGANSAAGGGVFFRNASPRLSNCVVQGNHTDNDGGGILLFSSDAVIDNCTIEGNTAGLTGGGLTIVGGSRSLILNSVIRNNTSGLAGQGGGGGGILVNDSSVTIRSTIITGNLGRGAIVGAGGGIGIIGVFGSPNGTATLILEDSEVSDNTQERFNTASIPSEGGGIHVEDNALARITRCRILNNTANSGGGLSSFRGRYEVIDSVIEGNHAQDPQAVGGFGGGIAASSLSPQGVVVILTDTVVRNNDALRAGGVLVTGLGCGAGGVCATLTMTRALVDNNVASTAGGGVNVGDVVLTVTDSQVLRNRLTDATGAFGGGFLITSSTASITNTTIAGNSAVLGGGLFIDLGANVTVHQSNIYDNTATATNGGGGLFVGQGGPPTGLIQGSQIADNSDFQIREEAGPPPGVPAPILTYAFNAIANQGLSKIYFSPVFPPGSITDITSFNNLSPGVKTVGNTGADPSFTSFAATPPQATSVLAWSSPRNLTVNITNIVDPQPGPTGSLDVTPECITDYTLGSVSARVIGTGTLSAPAICNGSQVVLVGENLGGTQVKQAERLVDAEQVTILTGGDITFLAGEQIVIRAPFVVETGAKFTAAVDACLCQ